jgi:hypothetical protein
MRTTVVCSGHAQPPMGANDAAAPTGMADASRKRTSFAARSEDGSDMATSKEEADEEDTSGQSRSTPPQSKSFP